MEPFVEDLPRLLSFDAARTGDDLPDRVDCVESLLRFGIPGAEKERAGVTRDGDGKGEERPLLLPLPKNGRRTAVRGDGWTGVYLLGDWDVRWLSEGPEMKFFSGEGPGGGTLTGSGNRGPLFFFRRGRRKKVVVVDTVCVVVVVA